jgi:hypothetical protein
VVAIRAIHLPGDGTNDIIQFDYAVRGKQPESFDIVLRRTGSTMAVPVDAAPTYRISQTITVTGALVRSQEHRYEIVLDQPLAREGEVFFLQIDPNGELEETRNDDNIVLGTAAKNELLTAIYDGNDDGKVFGQYIKNVSLQNTFTVRFPAADRDTVTNVRVEIGAANNGGIELVPTAVAPGVYLFNLDVGRWVDGTQITVNSTVRGLPETEMYEIDSITLPDWLIPQQTKNLLVTAEFSEAKGVYVLERRGTETLLPLPGSLEIRSGYKIALDYGLDAKVAESSDSAGLFLFYEDGRRIADILLVPGWIGHFGEIEINLSQPARALAGLLGTKSEDQTKAKKDSLTSEVTENGSASLLFKLASSPLQVSDSLELTGGKIETAFLIKGEYKLAFETPRIPVVVALGLINVGFSFEFGLDEGSIALISGYEVVDGAPKPQEEEMKETGVLKVGGKVVIALGSPGVKSPVKELSVDPVDIIAAAGEIAGSVKVEGSSEGSFASSMEIVAEVAASALSEFLKLKLGAVKIYEDKDLMDGVNGRFFPAVLDGLNAIDAALLGASALAGDAFEPNAGIKDAPVIAVNGGVGVVPDLTLPQNDVDTYRLRLLQDGSTGHRIQVTTTATANTYLFTLYNSLGEAVANGQGTGVISLERVEAGVYHLVVTASEAGIEMGYSLDHVLPERPAGASLAVDIAPDRSVVLAGETLYLTVTIENIGGAASEASRAVVRGSRDRMIDGNDAFAGFVDVPALAAGDRFTTVVPLIVQGLLGPNYFVGAELFGNDADAVAADDVAVRSVTPQLARDRFDAAPEPASGAIDLGTSSGGRTISALTLHGDRDIDTYTFFKPAGADASTSLNVNVESGSGFVTVTLSDVSGNVIRSITGGGANGSVLPIDLTALASGNFFLRVSSTLGLGDTELATYELIFQGGAPAVAQPALAISAVVQPEFGAGLSKALFIRISNRGDAASAATSGSIFLRQADGVLSGASVPFTAPALNPGQSVFVPVALVAGSPTKGLSLIAEFDGASQVLATGLSSVTGFDSEEVNEDASSFTDLGTISGVREVNGRNLHNGADFDGYRFRLSSTPVAGDRIAVTVGAGAGAVSVSLYADRGGLISSGIIPASGGTLQIPIETLPAGAYRLVLVGSSTVSTGYSLSLSAAGSTAANLAVDAASLSLPHIRRCTGGAIRPPLRSRTPGRTVSSATRFVWFASAIRPTPPGATWPWPLAISRS